MRVRIEQELWDALDEADKTSRSGVRYDPSPEMTGQDETTDGTATGFVVVSHPNIDEVDELLLAVAKIRHAKQWRANKNAS